MNHDKYTRRALMSRIGGAVAVSALTPFVPLLNADAEAATGEIIRYVPWYTPVLPSGDIVKNWMPNAQGALQWRGSFTALNPMRDKMSLIRGLGNKAGYVTGRDGNKMSGGHKPSGLTMLTGRELAKNRTGTQLEDGFSLGNYSSLDVWMGDEMVKNNDPIKRAYFLTGYRNASGFNNDEVWKSCSFRNGTFLQPHQTPKSLYDEMVRFAPSGGTPTGPANDGQRSAYLAVAEELKRLRRQLGSEDAARLDQHLEEINNLEKSLAISDTPSGASCDLPTTFANPMDQHDKYMNEYMKLIRIAFTCNVTRIIGHMDFGHLFTQGLNFLPDGNGNYHGATHDGGAANNRFIESVADYRAKNYVKLLQELDSVTEPSGKTLLDNSIVHWYTEVSRDHDWHDQFNVIGGGGGHFKMGLCKILGAPSKNPSDGNSSDKNTSINTYTQNRLLVSIANAMGFNITEFGNPSYNNGALPSEVLM